jgi:hypothetical protein
MATQIGALKIGGEKPWKIYTAAGLGVFALFLLVKTMISVFGGPDVPPPAPARPTTQPATTARTRTTGGNSSTKKAESEGSKSLDPTLRFDLLAQSEHTLYTGNGRNVFSLTAPPPPIPKVVASLHPDAVPTGPPPPPPKPRIMLTFYGYETSKGHSKRIFLINPNQDVFIAGEGDIVDRRYKVVKIAQSTVEIEDILNDDTQTIHITS